jgi:hypothetical protein
MLYVSRAQHINIATAPEEKTPVRNALLQQMVIETNGESFSVPAGSITQKNRVYYYEID